VSARPSLPLPAAPEPQRWAGMTRTTTHVIDKRKEVDKDGMPQLREPFSWLSLSNPQENAHG
jgi:hypothetical protein